MKEQNVVIITGMHRSGTSLIASFLQKAGLNVGDSLVGSHPGNVRGHFEDVDFYNFHEKLLHRFGQDHLVQATTALQEITAAETEEALALIKQRSSHTFWGWKDPRTSLFLNFWHNLLPEARYVLIYRHPVEVVVSLIRRAVELDLEVLANPIVGLRVWQVYNEAILNFYRQHSELCLLGHIDNITTNIEGFIRSTAKKLDLPLQATDVQALYHTAELKRIEIPEASRLILERIAPDVIKLYAQLESQADLPDQPFSQTVADQTSPLAELEGIVSNLANQDKLSESQAADYFALLLTILDPQAMVVGKAALDKFRVNYMNHLAAHATNLETHTTNLEAHRANLEAHVANLEAHRANLEAHVANLETHTANLEAYTANLERLLASKEANFQVLKEKIEAIERTKVWQLASKWYGFKHFLAGSK